MGLDNDMQYQIDKLRKEVEYIQVQQQRTYQIVESGLGHLTQQLETITRYNDAQKVIIKHLKAVVESNFVQINKQEDVLKETELKMLKINEIMKAIAVVVDEKCNGLETLKKTVATLEATFIPKPISPLVLPESGLDLVFDTPRSMKDYHLQQVNFSPAFPATPELFKEYRQDVLDFPPDC
jgi:hypothetical protein